MQLSLEQKRNMRHYAYVSGFRNVAWLTGYIEEIKENCLYISQNGSIIGSVFAYPMACRQFHLKITNHDSLAQNDLDVIDSRP